MQGKINQSQAKADFFSLLISEEKTCWNKNYSLMILKHKLSMVMNLNNTKVQYHPKINDFYLRHELEENKAKIS